MNTGSFFQVIYGFHSFLIVRDLRVECFVLALEFCLSCASEIADFNCWFSWVIFWWRHFRFNSFGNVTGSYIK